MEYGQTLLENKKLFYRVQGEGPLVMLLHGFAEDSTIWDRQYEALTRFKLVVPDLPGSGRSDMIDDMSLEGQAEAVFHIMQAENEVGASKATVIGHSMGGYIALALAERHPEALKSIGLFHSTAYADSEEKKQIRQKGIEFIRKHGGFEFLKTTTPNLYSPVTKEENPAMIEEQISTQHNFYESALVSYYTAMIARPDRTKILKESGLPVLFVLGRYDNAMPMADGLKQSHLPDISYIHILERSGHMGMREEAEQANQILINYLNSLYHQSQ
jgi:pimeloyl-ACP methyl ester carboxylesterase